MTHPARLLVLTGAATAALMAQPAAAQDGTHCGVTGSAVAPPTITYDPFGSLGLIQIPIPLTLTRFVGSQGEKTQQVNFVLTERAGSPGYQVLYQGTSILYVQGATMGHPQIDSQAPGEVNYNFGGATQPDTIQLPSSVVVTVPPSVDLSAGRPIDFEILYVCKGTGGLKNVSSPTVLPNAIHINVNVLSGLQASYVGSALDFGEVGDKSTAEVLGAPGAYATPPESNNIRVASSGPYRIEVASLNGYRMTYAGGDVGDPRRTLEYQLYFLGQTLSHASPLFVPTTCLRAGLGGIYLPIRARLMEGGRGAAAGQEKTPSPSYADVVTVTVTPLLDGAVSQQACPSVGLPPL